MSSRIVSLVRALALILSLELPIILAFAWMTGDYSIPRFNVWPISEWLINYQAGFVRRGLAGEFLLQVFGQDGLIKPLYVLMFASYIAYIVSFLLVYWRSGIRNGNVLLVSILIQGGIFHMGMSADFYTRKENLFLIFFAIQCLLYFQIRLAPVSRQQFWIYCYLVALFIVSPVLVLIHEAYLFMAYPISALLLWVLALERPNLRYLRLASIFLFAEVLFTFLVCSRFHGDVFMAQAIWDSLSFGDRLLLSPSAPYSVFGAISSLGWGLDQHLTTIYGVFSSGGIFIWLFFGLGNVLVLIYIYSVVRPVVVDGLPSQYLRWILLGGLALTPMFLLASDWGRWLASMSSQLILLMFVLRRADLSYKPEDFPLLLALDRRLVLAGGVTLLAFCVIYGLAFQMPECCAYYTDIFPSYRVYFGL
ncbi:hypothetical protein [Polynucleobacter sp. AP-Nino-20-G2]|uniref:hypothetical protein n=1 Tax=Polynucleobacter sp. AP-Nino-20-G2 TaxID=2576917 RepID=UPI001BFE6A7E|nr:hypothetical protein [Polynucleobacter sp. AP-Nino-20-G2]QWE17249.1 hypothetical protein FD960_03265 [Polynucleobacter sp. AP-Nino-20-G2]